MWDNNKNYGKIDSEGRKIFMASLVLVIQYGAA
jgi:hypothetical protein